MQLARHEITNYRFPYPSPVRWKDTIEDSGLLAPLKLVAEDGSAGGAEGPIEPAWAGVMPRALIAALDDMLLPALQGIDICDPAAVRKRLASFSEDTLAKGAPHSPTSP